jgi:hypothetical protein
MLAGQDRRYGTLATSRQEGRSLRQQVRGMQTRWLVGRAPVGDRPYAAATRAADRIGLLSALREPVVDRAWHFALGAAGHVDADVAALERELGVVLRADQVLQRT